MSRTFADGLGVSAEARAKVIAGAEKLGCHANRNDDLAGAECVTVDNAAAAAKVGLMLKRAG